MSALCNKDYNREQYLKEFRINIMPDDFKVSVETLPPGFSPKYIKKASILGKSEKLELNMYEIIYDSAHDPRIGLTRDAFRLMAGYNCNKALMFFVPENNPSQYRISLVTIEPKLDEKGIKVINQYSNPRRYSYLLGERAKIQTPKRYLFNKGAIKDEKDLFERFNIEVVNKDFFTNIARLFTELVGGKRKFGSHEEDFKPLMKLPSTKDENVYKEFAVRLIGRTVFTWFLKKKVSDKGVPLIPDDLLSLYRVNKTKNFYHSILEPLFFELLNTETDKRKKPFRTKEFDLIPFLNGGLFEPKTEDFYELDDLQNSSKYTNTLVIPDEWFVQFFELLETYNFTLDESSSIDVELSVDPEMLGRIFENLLAEINPETGESARKSTGSFYTPRQIVDYMVDRSLSYYLTSKTKIEQPKIDELLKYDTDKFDLTVDQIKKITDAIYSLKVLDPACGSGAFPMGMLNKIMMVLDKFDSSSFDFISRYLDEIKDKKDRVAEEKRLYNKDWRYKHKLSVIRNSIYGVDIQPIAADISKLRFFLSLVVDEKINDNEDNRGVLPLPNLEFKFAIANTLISLPKKEHGSSVNLFQDETEDKLKKLIKEYFEASSEKKDKIKKNITELQAEMVRNTIKWKDTKSSYFHLSDFKPFENKATQWFDPEWMYGLEENEGFDIVIGNPPYVQIQKFSGQQCQKDWEDQKYETFTKTGDIYCLFYERGHKLLNKNGYLTFITSNKWMRAGYGEATRKYFSNNTNPVLLVDFGGYKVFESATVDTNILTFKNDSNSNSVIACTIDKDFTQDKDIDSYIRKNHIILNDVSKESWIILSKEEFRIRRKIERIGTQLKNWNLKIYSGIKIGFNDAFIIDGKTKKILLKEEPESEEIIKPLLRGKDLKRYKSEFADLWLITTHNGYINAKGKSVPRIDIKKYPAVKKHLDKYLSEIENRYDKGDTPYNLRNCAYMEEFENEKIILTKASKEQAFAYVKNPLIVLNTSYIIIGGNLKYLTSILNSNLAKYIFLNFYQGGGISGEITIFAAEQIPIPKISKTEQKPFEVLVDNILKKKEKGQDTTEEENKIDIMVYKLYELDYDEVKIIDPEIEKIISRKDYDKLKCFESTGKIEDDSLKENEDTEVPSVPTVKRTRKKNTQEEDLFEKADTETDINKIKAQTWKNLATWAKDKDKLEGWERRFVFIVGSTVNKNGKMSEKQLPIAEKIWNKAKEEGFEG